MTRFAVAIAMCFAVTGCKNPDKTAYPDCSSSSGTCHAQSIACGIEVRCSGRTLALQCTPPADPQAKTIQCQCVENSVVGKRVELAFRSSDSPFTGDLKAIVKSACGYPE